MEQKYYLEEVLMISEDVFIIPKLITGLTDILSFLLK